jgi:hypothetical protein
VIDKVSVVENTKYRKGFMEYKFAPKLRKYLLLSGSSDKCETYF